MRLTLLGSGTSQGVPVIGCICAVCTSKDKRDKRLRTSAWIADDNFSVAIDCGPDFRQQMLREKVEHIDAVLMTHEHSDHIAGIEELRSFQFRQRRPMPIYATPSVQNSLKQRYDYAFFENPYPGAVQLNLHTIDVNIPFYINQKRIVPLDINHGSINVLGFRFGELTYITDCKSISSIELEKIKGTQYLILDALHHQEHHAHMTLQQALAIVETIKPKNAYFVHMSHLMGKHKDVNKALPKGVQLAWDGLVIDFEGYNS
jgi:phosphoribosyl 1,2-cyclic phosphate phosphodiesterase